MSFEAFPVRKRTSHPFLILLCEPNQIILKMTTISIKLSPELAKFDDKEIIIEIDGNGILKNTPRTPHKDELVFAYFDNLIRHLMDDGRTGTADNYKCAESIFMKFCKYDNNLRFDKIDAAFIDAYENYLRKKGVKLTTLSFYMRTLRAMYNMAVRDGAATDNNPFRNACTAIGPTPKRAITFEDVRKISLMYIRARQTALARDMFMLSFFTRGMPFIDMAFLKKTDLKNGVLTYKRKKTGQVLSVKWERCMQDIVDMHPSRNNVFLLPIINDPDGDLRKQYKNSQRYFNERLTRLGNRLHIGTPLTMYVARHSWASIAKGIGVPITVISEALGHTSLKTTQIYLKSINAEVIDKANSMVIRTIMEME